MRVVNYIHKLQGFDKAFPILLELRERCREVEVMTVVDLEEKTKLETAAFFSDLCVELSDHVAVCDETQFGAEIGEKARLAGKLRYRKAGRTYAQTLSALWRRLSASSAKEASTPIEWAASADCLLGIYNGFRRPLAAKLRHAVKGNEGRVIGYFKAINDEGHGISALENPHLRKLVPPGVTHSVDVIMLPYDGFSTFFGSDTSARLVTTGYPPFYRCWKKYVESRTGDRDNDGRDALDVVVLARGEAAHKEGGQQIITNETLSRILHDIYEILQKQTRSFRLQVKPHPYQDVGILAAIIEGWPEAQLVFDPPVVLAARADVMIAIYSSAILDGVVFKATLIEYFEENSAFRELHATSSPFASFGVAIARTRDELDAVIENALRRRRANGANAKVDEANLLAQRLPATFTNGSSNDA
jgi:hypothetical protein